MERVFDSQHNIWTFWTFHIAVLDGSIERFARLSFVRIQTMLAYLLLGSQHEKDGDNR